MKAIDSNVNIYILQRIYIIRYISNSFYNAEPFSFLKSLPAPVQYGSDNEEGDDEDDGKQQLAQLLARERQLKESITKSNYYKW